MGSRAAGNAVLLVGATVISGAVLMWAPRAANGQASTDPAHAPADAGTVAVPIDIPGVPPLAPGETPPADLPNYFDARELGAGTLVAFEGCFDAFKQAEPDASDDYLDDKCTCIADAVRLNVRAGHEATFSDVQGQKCQSYALHPAGRSPFAVAAGADSAQIQEVAVKCFRALPPNLPSQYAGPKCSCWTDAVLKDGQRPAALASDIDKCEIVARHAYLTGKWLTQRQFAALPTSAAQASPTTPASPGVATLITGSQATQGVIPYPGNGLGPTLCSDGSVSGSAGSGTCSHHGGISGGRHRRGH
jgi:hypothetical protein